MKLFKKKNKLASPYYGGTAPLIKAPALPPPQKRDDEDREKRLATRYRITEADWERRHYELVVKIILQERKSVVLGKLKADDAQIVARARKLADAAIRELQTHPYKTNEKETE